MHVVLFTLQLALDTWKRVMIEPLKDALLGLILREVQTDRVGGSVNQHVLQGVILSFVKVEKFKKKGGLQVSNRVGACWI